jgi:hypothetical protein
MNAVLEMDSAVVPNRPGSAQDAARDEQGFDYPNLDNLAAVAVYEEVR